MLTGVHTCAHQFLFVYLFSLDDFKRLFKNKHLTRWGLFCYQCSANRKHVFFIQSVSLVLSYTAHHLLKASSVDVCERLSSFPVAHKALGRRSYCLLCSQNCTALFFFFFSSLPAKPQITLLQTKLFRLSRGGLSWLSKTWSHQSDPNY